MIFTSGFCHYSRSLIGCSKSAMANVNKSRCFTCQLLSMITHPARNCHPYSMECFITLIYKIHFCAIKMGCHSSWNEKSACETVCVNSSERPGACKQLMCRSVIFLGKEIAIVYTSYGMASYHCIMRDFHLGNHSTGDVLLVHKHGGGGAAWKNSFKNKTFSPLQQVKNVPPPPPQFLKLPETCLKKKST